MGSGEETAEDRGSNGSGTGLRNWLLLDGSRTAVAGITAGLFFICFAVVSTSRFSPLRDVQPLFYVFSSLIGGNLTIVTVVVSINQLLLSRELQTPNELQSQIDGVIDYRADVEEAAGRTAPVEPLGFLRLTLENTRRRAGELNGVSANETSEDVTDEIDEIVSRVTGQVDRVDRLLDRSNASMFKVLSATLATNYARDINRLRQVRSRDVLPSDVSDDVDDLVHRLQNIDVARQYFKSIYLQQELASLSRLLFYTGLPSVGVVAATLFVFTGRTTATTGSTALALLLSAVVTVGLVPLIVLFAFIVRTATVTRQTAATIPFTAPEQEE